MTAHVPGLLGHIGPADRDGLSQITGFPILVGKGREVAAGILVELLFEFLNPGGAGHLVPSGVPPEGRQGREKIYLADERSQSEVTLSLDLRCRGPLASGPSNTSPISGPASLLLPLRGRRRRELFFFIT
jgi:hypothetical protein